MEHQIQKKSWFARNWPWVVPLGGCLTLIVMFMVFIGPAIFGVSKLFTGAEPYKDGLAKVQQDEYLLSLLGEPIETDGIMQGNISYTNGDSNANIAIPIKGPKNTAKVYVVGTKENNKWSYTEMYVIINETDEQIDLLGYDHEQQVDKNQ